MWGKLSNISTLDFKIYYYTMKVLGEDVGIPLSFLVLKSWMSPHVM